MEDNIKEKIYNAMEESGCAICERYKVVWTGPQDNEVCVDIFISFLRRKLNEKTEI